MKHLSPLQAKEVGDVLETLVKRDMPGQAITLLESIVGKVTNIDFEGLSNYILEFSRSRLESNRFPAKSHALATQTYQSIKKFVEGS